MFDTVSTFISTLPSDKVLVGSIVLIVLLIAWIIFLEVRITRLTRGKSGADLEDTLRLVEKDIKSLSEFQTDMEEYLLDVERRLKRSAQGMSTIRFNAFEGTGDGGQQSFASAFLNEHGDGVVLSSIRARDRVGIYAKPIKKYKSEFELTKEEKQAIAEAKLS